MLTAAAVKTKALELGFDACGVAPASDFPELLFFREWLSRGYAGRMRYLERSADRRASVTQVVRSARSVIATATRYDVDRPRSIENADPGRALISRHAWGDDYHEVLQERLNGLVAWMRDVSQEPFDVRACVDTGPIQERIYARYAGLGWIGKNSCLVNAELGSFVFLAEIVCSLPLQPDAPGMDRCGSCTLCLDACPTDALVAPGVLDATRCISYLTVEPHGPVPASRRAPIGTHVYGCDICQDVCPWNQLAARSADPAWQPRAAWDRVDLADLASRGDDELQQAMRGSAMQRLGVAGLRRNVAAAFENSIRLRG
jgi:epoxyqueuosine reductase